MTQRHMDFWLEKSHFSLLDSYPESRYENPFPWSDKCYLAIVFQKTDLTGGGKKKHHSPCIFCNEQITAETSHLLAAVHILLLGTNSFLLQTVLASHLLRESALGWMFVSPQNSLVETLTPKVTALGGGGLGEVIKSWEWSPRGWDWYPYKSSPGSSGGAQW